MKRQWEQEELIDQWTLSAMDRALLGNKTGATRLGFALLLKYFYRLGRFPQHKNEIPRIVVSYVATQVGVDPAAYLQYDWQGRTIKVTVQTYPKEDVVVRRARHWRKGLKP